jgi:hypothetical protein
VAALGLQHGDLLANLRVVLSQQAEQRTRLDLTR